MEYRRLGNSGLKVSRICFGGMSIGSSKWDEWVLDEEQALPIIKKAYDAGINFFDTANVYSNGESERVLGKAFKQFNIPRENIVIATKVSGLLSKDIGDNTFFRSVPVDVNTVNNKGLSRKHIFEAVEASLERLQTTYIDLYQIHRWNYDTPIEETMCALNDLVRSGKVRYIGASSMWTWQFQKAQHIAEKNGWTKFISMQDMYNLLYREEEREMIPCCGDMGVALLPWSPLARGILTGRKKTKRTDTDKGLTYFAPTQADEVIIDRVIEIAEKKGLEPSQVAMAWLLSKPNVVAPIVGFSKIEYLDGIIGALQVKLSEEETKYLEEPYVPKKTVGFQ